MKVAEGKYRENKGDEVIKNFSGLKRHYIQTKDSHQEAHREHNGDGLEHQGYTENPQKLPQFFLLSRTKIRMALYFLSETLDTKKVNPQNFEENHFEPKILSPAKLIVKRGK